MILKKVYERYELHHVPKFVDWCWTASIALAFLWFFKILLVSISEGLTWVDLAVLFGGFGFGSTLRTASYIFENYKRRQSLDENTYLGLSKNGVFESNDFSASQGANFVGLFISCLPFAIFIRLLWIHQNLL